MSKELASVRARGTALCPDFEAIERGVRRMIGRTYEQVTPGQWGWKPTNKAESVPRCRDIAHAIAHGDLFAADADTAEWAARLTRKDVKFDPTFGGAVPAEQKPQGEQAPSGTPTSESSSQSDATQTTPSEPDASSVDSTATSSHHADAEASR